MGLMPAAGMLGAGMGVLGEDCAGHLFLLLKIMWDPAWFPAPTLCILECR